MKSTKNYENIKINNEFCAPKNHYDEVFRNDKHFSKKIGAVQAYIQHNRDF